MMKFAKLQKRLDEVDVNQMIMNSTAGETASG